MLHITLFLLLCKCLLDGSSIASPSSVYIYSINIASWSPFPLFSTNYTKTKSLYVLNLFGNKWISDSDWIKSVFHSVGQSQSLLLYFYFYNSKVQIIENGATFYWLVAFGFFLVCFRGIILLA